MTAYWITGDACIVMAELEPGSVDLVVTSPPFLALRSYLPDGDPAKVHEMGSEANPAEFVDALLDVTEACARLLTPHGSLVIELGDTYAGANGWGDEAGNVRYPNGRGIGTGPRPQPKGRGWPLDKSLSLVPEAYRMALAYGRNPHNGRQTDPWRIRNVIRWVRPNPPVGALGDKFRPATSEMVVACKARDRWFDLDAVRTPHATGDHHLRYPDSAYMGTGKGAQDARGGGGFKSPINPAGAPPLDWWQISPGGYPGSHYAVYPPELVVRPVEAMCPRRVCRTCGVPSRRIVDARRLFDGEPITTGRMSGRQTNNGGSDRIDTADGVSHNRFTTDRTTTGWSTCGCPGADGVRLDGYHTGPGWRPGVVLDPFGGSGTTASVASGHSRDSISVDLDARNADLARERVGMWLQETTAAELAS